MTDHRARKRFGQNFLVDHQVINRIVRVIHPQAGDNLVEIGPGKGALTRLLLEHCPTLRVIELDRDLVPILQAEFLNAGFSGLVIHQADALKFDFGELAAPDRRLRVVGNLPYNISTPLIFHLLSFENQVEDMHFMLQKEVVERLAAIPGNKNYGRLSIMTQYHCHVENLFNVAPGSFHPAPKVESAIVRLTPFEQKPFVARSLGNLEKLVRVAFQQRRKTLKNALKNLGEDIDPAKVDLDLSQRAEKLSVQEYVRLSNCLWPG